MSTTILPPDLPENAVYTRCYCEENIYLLCRDFLSKPEIAEKWNLWVLFVSNENKMAALFFQKSSRREDLPVLWDYHVILILQPRVDSDLDERRELRGNASWAYDFDTRLPIPCPWEDYLEMTFPKDLLTEYER
ncbi:hypothetical protein CC1G_03901 [Coprinopsis cinerea okayama7|uniref:Protein N-terminal glutamine amidohydrolase n=1 Tax=Coprinopsis cinerea (strain Okayama-7 / 130 / ATCC MYA-4618 / FGSC 9003) TaxID=240176 RepID=A8NH54_COPC7|nr:hypothetical protein CC1G_03901 [Coprinopsis cinerea okayama7\|eukprot:XP_001833684.2 hypothetical protein CC1G_03901 [Coprinopsis cinerea okayama7\